MSSGSLLIRGTVSYLGAKLKSAFIESGLYYSSEPGENEPAVSGFSPQSRSTVALSNSLFWRYEMLEEKAKDS